LLAPVENSQPLCRSMASARQTSASLQVKGTEMVMAARERITKVAKASKVGAVKVLSERSFQVAAASAAGSATVLGAGGAVTGLFAGGTLGAAIGIVPAIFTFGLSIPVGIAVGAGCGAVAGGVAGSAGGLAGGGAAGYGAYSKRAEIRNLANKVQTQLFQALGRTRAAATSCALAARTKAADTRAALHKHVSMHLVSAKDIAMQSAARASSTAKVAGVKAKELASDKTVQVTTASAAGGAAVLGAGGAVSGLVVGGTIGAALGVVPAIFTFGLSIPLFAVVGSGCGLVTGTGVGSATGATLGGVSGFGFTRRKEIGSKVDGAASYVKVRAYDSAEYVRAKLGGATGETSY